MTIVTIQDQPVRVTKTKTREYLKKQLGSNIAWAKKALILISDNQTDDEMRNESTSDLNGIGFTGTDAQLLTSFAKQLMQRGSLSPKQMQLTLKKMPKYWNQILSVSNLETLNNNVAKYILREQNIV